MPDPPDTLDQSAGLAGRDSLHLVYGVIESLTAASSAATVLVGVDDVHLLDDLSTFVLHQIVQRRATKVVLTVRDGPVSVVNPATPQAQRAALTIRLLHGNAGGL